MEFTLQGDTSPGATEGLLLRADAYASCAVMLVLGRLRRDDLDLDQLLPCAPLLELAYEDSRKQLRCDIAVLCMSADKGRQ